MAQNIIESTAMTYGVKPREAAVPFQPVYAVGGPSADAVSPSTRLALVVGIDDYPGKAALQGAARDAKLIADTLASEGFTLIGGTVQLNLTSNQMKRVFDDLVRLAKGSPGALVVIYFSGHGAVADHRNLVVPKDGDLTAPATSSRRGSSVMELGRRLRSAGVRLTVMFLDDCRDDPDGQDSFVPEIIPDNTFISYSTRLGGIANDENSMYSRQLNRELSSGFDTLVNVHIRVIQATTRTLPFQFPVFSVGRHMPSQPVLFFPARQDETHETRAIAKREIGLAQQCDDLTRFENLTRLFSVGSSQNAEYVSACEKAWANGWRSREVLRGYALSKANFQHSMDLSLLGYLLQAAEMGDGTASFFALATVMAERTPLNLTSRQDYNVLLREGVSVFGLNVNNIDEVIDYSVEQALKNDDDTAKLALSINIGDPSRTQTRYLHYDNKALDLARKTIEEFAERGDNNAVVYILVARIKNEDWYLKLPVRQYLSNSINKVYTYFIPPGSDTIQYVHETIEEQLFFDLFTGKYGPADPRAAVDLALKTESEHSFFSSSKAVSPAMMCALIGEMLVLGRTTNTGIPVIRDVVTGTRLLRYAASHGVSAAQSFMGSMQIQ